ncbi:MAG: hypothetical protein QNJ51_00725 [Calothrix sp. MO_167.B12]|nr:hypothetical protein [Calothrix sp. MO_167.B12]
MSERESEVIKLKKYSNFRAEAITVFLLIALFLLLNFVVISRFPTVWLDEVMFADPGVNLYIGKGFTSSAWLVQNKDAFWAGNAPFYSFLLSQWMRLFDFSIVSVRSLGYVLIAISALALWLSVFRLNLVPSAWARISFVLLLLSGYGIGINYRTGRYDSLTICLCAVAVLSYSIQSIWLRCLVLSLTGFFFLISGFQLISYTVIVCCLLLVFLGKSFFKEFASLLIGILIGGVFLYLIYSTHGVWNSFLESVHALRTMPDGRLPKDPSLFFMLIAAFSIAIQQINSKNFKIFSPLMFSLLISLFVPLLTMAAGRFPTYYTWMVYIPLTIGVCSSLSNIKFHFRKVLHSLIIISLFVSCLFGTPLQTFSGLYYWNNRDYQYIDALAERNVKSNDWVYCDSAAYYAVKKRAEFTATDFYIKAMTPQEKNKISLLIIPADKFESIINTIGGKWSSSLDKFKSTKDFLIFKSNFGDKLIGTYNLQVFRRISPLPSSTKSQN